MKNFLLSVIFILLCNCTYAQVDFFQLNEYGVCEIVREVSGENAHDLYKKIKAWLGACNMQWSAVPNSDEVDKKIDFNASFNSAMRYNPFAGWFNQDFLFDGHFTINENTAKLVLNNMRIRETYSGFGAKIEETAIEDKIEAYNKCLKILKDGPDPTLDKKTQKSMLKDAKDDIKDYEDVLNKAGEEFKERLSKLDKIFK